MRNSSFHIIRQIANAVKLNSEMKIKFFLLNFVFKLANKFFLFRCLFLFNKEDLLNSECQNFLFQFKPTAKLL